MEYSFGIIWVIIGVNIGKYSSSMEHLGSLKIFKVHKTTVFFAATNRSEVLENLNESHPGPRQRVADVGIEPLIWEPGGFEIWKIHGK